MTGFACPYYRGFTSCTMKYLILMLHGYRFYRDVKFKNFPGGTCPQTPLDPGGSASHTNSPPAIFLHSARELFLDLGYGAI